MMILDIIENVPMLILPIYLVYVIAYFIVVIIKKPISSLSILKYWFCIKITSLIIVSTFMIIILQEYQLAVIWNEYELTYTLDPIVKSFSFALLEFIWSLIAVVLSWSVFKWIYFRQIIPGVGTVRERLKMLLKKSKSEESE